MRKFGFGWWKYSGNTVEIHAACQVLHYEIFEQMR